MTNRLINKKILCFITQPLVENAVKHGMKSNPYGKIDISIDAARHDEWLMINIRNTGTLENNGTGTGIGITNVKDRLNSTYPGKYFLEITQDGPMVKVEIKIPCHE